MRLRFLLAYSLLLVAVGPLFDHHSAERDPFHSHLAQTAVGAHRHELDRGHLHARSEAPNAGAIALRDGTAAPAAGAAAGVSVAIPAVDQPARGSVSEPVGLDATVRPPGRFLPQPDPPPRLPL